MHVVNLFQVANYQFKVSHHSHFVIPHVGTSLSLFSVEVTYLMKFLSASTKVNSSLQVALGSYSFFKRRFFFHLIVATNYQLPLLNWAVFCMMLPIYSLTPT